MGYWDERVVPCFSWILLPPLGHSGIAMSFLKALLSLWSMDYVVKLEESHKPSLGSLPSSVVLSMGLRSLSSQRGVLYTIR